MNLRDLSGLPDNFDYVIHCALVSATSSSEYDSPIAHNVESAALLMRHCQNASGFLHVSSSVVYARHQEHPQHAYTETDAVGGFASYLPIYPVIKISTEGAVRGAARILELPTTIARLNLAYGSTGHGGLPIFGFYQMMAKGKSIPVPIGYSNMSSPIAGEDLAAQAERLLQVASVPATVVNWAGDDAVSDREMCEYIGEITGLTPTFVESKISWDTFISDNTRRQELIGACSVHWKDGIRDTLIRRGVIPGSVRAVD
jgi:nucleoside-diphosphate-sugar epimerase